MARASCIFTTPMLFCIGFLFAFLMGGVTGVMLASPPIDFATHDTYFVVAHFHQVLFGTAVFAGFAGLYYWYPKMFGRMLRERLGKWHFWLIFIGFWLTFMPQYVVGLKGMPRRVACYPSNLGWQIYNRSRPSAPSSSPSRSSSSWSTSWCRGATRCWPATIRGTRTRSSGSPPRPRRTTTTRTCPPIRSERPTWDYNHPDALALKHGPHAATSSNGRNGSDGTKEKAGV